MGDENQHVVVAKSGPRRRVANPVAISASGVQIPAATSITSVQKYEKMSTKEEPTETNEIKYFVRIKNFDLDGTKSTERALLSLPGIGRRVASILINQAGLSPKDTLGLLDDDSIDTARYRLSLYHSVTEPLIDYYEETEVLVRVDGVAEEHVVFDRITTLLAKKGLDEPED